MLWWLCICSKFGVTKMSSSQMIRAKHSVFFTDAFIGAYKHPIFEFLHWAGDWFNCLNSSFHCINLWFCIIDQELLLHFYFLAGINFYLNLSRPVRTNSTTYYKFCKSCVEVKKTQIQTNTVFVLVIPNKKRKWTWKKRKEVKVTRVIVEEIIQVLNEKLL